MAMTMSSLEADHLVESPISSLSHSASRERTYDNNNNNNNNNNDDDDDLLPDDLLLSPSMFSHSQSPSPELLPVQPQVDTVVTAARAPVSEATPFAGGLSSSADVTDEQRAHGQPLSRPTHPSTRPVSLMRMPTATSTVTTTGLRQLDSHRPSPLHLQQGNGNHNHHRNQSHHHHHSVEPLVNPSTMTPISRLAQSPDANDNEGNNGNGITLSRQVPNSPPTASYVRPRVSDRIASISNQIFASAHTPSQSPGATIAFTTTTTTRSASTPPPPVVTNGSQLRNNRFVEQDLKSKWKGKIPVLIHLRGFVGCLVDILLTVLFVLID
jgi:hypothetical protein